MLSRLLLGALALASATQSVVADCGFRGLNFSSLIGTDLVAGDGRSPQIYAFYLSVCGTLSSNASAPCTEYWPSTSACQMQVWGGTGTFGVGNWIADDPPVWDYIDPNNHTLGVMYSMPGAQSCWAHPPVQNYLAHVRFVCNETAGPLTVTVRDGSCIQNYTYPTPLACNRTATFTGGAEPTRNLSSGWLLILLLCGVIPRFGWL